MLIWGTKGTTFTADKNYALNCANCGHDEHVGLVLAKYFHLFWIPTFLWVQEVGLTCTHCQRFSCGNDVLPEVHAEVKRTSLPLIKKMPYFTGLFLLVAIFTWGYFSNVEHQRRTREFLAAPQVNDMYIADLSEFMKIEKGDTIRYGLMRVGDVSEGQILLKVGRTLSNQERRIKDDARQGAALKEDYFLESALVLSRGDLQSLMDNGTIKDVMRMPKSAAAP